MARRTVVTDRNRLSMTFPEIALEWHPTKNGKLTPKDVSYGSSKKVWWLCKKKHYYIAKIQNRTIGRNNCKQCSDIRRESLVASELKQWCNDNFNNVEFEHRMLKSPKNKMLRCDIYIRDANNINRIYIEINGGQHYKFYPRYHRTKEQFEYTRKTDRMKRAFARKNGQYIEIDLRKIKTTEEAIQYVLSKINP